MNTEQYEDLRKVAQSIQGFGRMVSSESKYKVALNVLCSLASIEPRIAHEFISEYYSRMDIKLTSPKVLFNDLNK
jgi:hypothetical protein